MYSYDMVNPIFFFVPTALINVKNVMGRSHENNEQQLLYFGGVTTYGKECAKLSREFVCLNGVCTPPQQQ